MCVCVGVGGGGGGGGGGGVGGSCERGSLYSVPHAHADNLQLAIM